MNPILAAVITSATLFRTYIVDDRGTTICEHQRIVAEWEINRGEVTTATILPLKAHVRDDAMIKRWGFDVTDPDEWIPGKGPFGIDPLRTEAYPKPPFRRER